MSNKKKCCLCVPIECGIKTLGILSILLSIFQYCMYFIALAVIANDRKNKNKDELLEFEEPTHLNKIAGIVGVLFAIASPIPFI